MALAFDIRLLGDKALEKKLAGLERKLQRKIIVSSLRKQAKRTGQDVVKMVEARIQPDTGLLVAAIAAMAKKPVALKRSRRRIGLGIRTPERSLLAPTRSKNPNLWYVPGILEYGDKGSEKSASGRGPLTPRRFYRDAVDENIEASFAIMAKEMGDDVIKVAKGA